MSVSGKVIFTVNETFLVKDRPVRFYRTDLVTGHLIRLGVRKKLSGNNTSYHFELV